MKWGVMCEYGRVNDVEKENIRKLYVGGGGVGRMSFSVYGSVQDGYRDEVVKGMNRRIMAKGFELESNGLNCL